MICTTNRKNARGAVIKAYARDGAVPAYLLDREISGCAISFYKKRKRDLKEENSGFCSYLKFFIFHFSFCKCKQLPKAFCVSFLLPEFIILLVASFDIEAMIRRFVVTSASSFTYLEVLQIVVN